MKTQLLLPAAGLGTRLGQNIPKALVKIAGKPLLIHTLERLAPLGLLDSAVIVVTPSDRAEFEQALSNVLPGCALKIVDGGAERQDSVQRGLDALEAATDIVVIHDAARPFVATESVRASIDAAAQYGAATVAIPSVDTILQGDVEAFLQATPDRRFLWACQTPQTFRVDVIRKAHAAARADGFLGTDDASLVRRMGAPVKLVQGTPLNFKVTTPSDLRMAELVIREGLA